MGFKSITEIQMKNIYDDRIKKKVYKLNKMFLKSKEKAAYYYENINSETSISFNPNICFYAASTIKILVSLYLFQEATNGKLNIEDKLLITKEDIRPGTGIIKNQSKDTKYSIKDLLKYNIEESDNTAYIKLVNYVGKEKLIEFGKSLGAKHPLEGKDLFGIINCSDMLIYLKRIRDFILNNKLGKDFSNYLANPSFKIIKDSNLNNNEFLRKYGAWDIAYHELGIVNDKNPFYLIILTQKFKKKEKDQFINSAAKKIMKIHTSINKKHPN